MELKQIKLRKTGNAFVFTVPRRYIKDGIFTVNTVYDITIESKEKEAETNGKQNKDQDVWQQE